MTDVVIAGLHEMEIGDRHLVVNRASAGARSAVPMLPSMMPGAIGYGPTSVMSTAALGSVAQALVGPVAATRVLVLHNMITPADLVDDEEYHGL